MPVLQHTTTWQPARDMCGERAQFSYDLSPIQIIVSEQSRPWYHFVTTTSAIVGGVFTVAGIVDGLVHTGASMAKKLDLGKQA